MIIGARLQECLDDCGMSQAELARRVGQDQSTINSLIRGDQRSSTKLHQIAREVRTTPAYLTGETDDRYADAPDEPELDREEREFVELLREIPPKERSALLTITRCMASHGHAPTSNTSHEPAREFRRASG